MGEDTGRTPPKPIERPVPQQDNLLKELTALVREIASSADRDISEAVAWLHSHGL